MNTCRTAHVTQDKTDYWRRCLASPHRIENEQKNTIDCITVDMGDGYQAVIKLCNSVLGPYVDAALFEDGSEVSFGVCGEPWSLTGRCSAEELAGEYRWKVYGLEFVLTVAIVA